MFENNTKKTPNNVCIMRDTPPPGLNLYIYKNIQAGRFIIVINIKLMVPNMQIYSGLNQIRPNNNRMTCRTWMYSQYRGGFVGASLCRTSYWRPSCTQNAGSGTDARPCVTSDVSLGSPIAKTPCYSSQTENRNGVWQQTGKTAVFLWIPSFGILVNIWRNYTCTILWWLLLATSS